jgi:hypothetical protein
VHGSNGFNISYDKQYFFVILVAAGVSNVAPVLCQIDALVNIYQALPESAHC